MSEHAFREQDDPLYSKSVLEMVTLANEYCRFLDKSEEYALNDLLLFLQKIIPLIYLKSSLIPVVEATDEDAVEHYVTEEQWETMFNMLHNKFGPSDEFYFIDLQERSHNDPVKGSIAECLTDAYQDLQDFLLLYQKPLRTFKENAVNECKRLFESRYGIKLINAHGAVHAILYSANDPGTIF
jgi:hypothetical protein